MSEGLQNLIACAFVVIWFGGGIILYLRHRRKRGNYLRHFRSTAGYPLDAYANAEIITREGRAIYRTIWLPQDDPELERLRLDQWRGVGYVVLWIFGFPLLVSGVVAILILLH